MRSFFESRVPKLPLRSFELEVGSVSVVKINQRPRSSAQPLFTIERIGLNNLICHRISFRNEPSATGDVVPPFLLHPGFTGPTKDVVGPFTVVAGTRIGRGARRAP